MAIYAFNMQHSKTNLSFSIDKILEIIEKTSKKDEVGKKELVENTNSINQSTIYLHNPTHTWMVNSEEKEQRNSIVYYSRDNKGMKTTSIDCYMECYSCLEKPRMKSKIK